MARSLQALVKRDGDRVVGPMIRILPISPDNAMTYKSVRLRLAGFAHRLRIDL